MCATPSFRGAERGLTKREILKRLCHIEGVYVPAFYDVPIGPTAAWKPSRRKKARRPWCARPSFRDMNSQPLPENFVVPMIGAVHDRAQIEGARLRAGCRFCQAGFIYRPMRERDADMFPGGAQPVREYRLR